MPGAKAWVYCVGRQTPHLQAVQVALARQDIDLRVTSCDRSIGPGIVIFDAPNEPILRLTRRMAQDGLNHILAVISSGQAVATSECWRLLQNGAADVVIWDRLPDPAEAIAARIGRWMEIESLMNSSVVQENLAGRSRAWLRVLKSIVEIGRFADTSVLITGASGTGKELVARLIHELDRRPNKGQLVVLDCTTVAPELSGSEFFGHERGAFTTAVNPRDGAFALADGGTLFLDEVGELPLRLQAELLRVVQERTYKRVGSNTWRQINFRLVCATNRDLDLERVNGRFREDLYYRIAASTCHLPPLAERREDVLPLVHHFLRRLLRTSTPPELDPAVREFLLGRKYPGNVRELQQVVTRLVARYTGQGPITIGAVPEEERESELVADDAWPDAAFTTAVRAALARGRGLNDIRNAAMETAYGIVLDEEAGDTSRSSERLHVSQRAVQQYLQGRNGRSANASHAVGSADGRSATTQAAP